MKTLFKLLSQYMVPNLKKVLILTLLIGLPQLFTISYAQNRSNEPLCIASDTGVGGPRYIETTFPIDGFISNPETVSFNLRCKGDVPIKIVPDNNGSPEAKAFIHSLEQYKPRQKAFYIYTTVKTSTGKILKNKFDVFEQSATEPGEPIYLDALGPGKFHNLSVEIYIANKIFDVPDKPTNPTPIASLYLPILDVSQNGGQPSYAPYNIILAMGMDAFPDPCITPALDVWHPDTIDFGTLKKEDFNSTISDSFLFRLRRPKTDSCSQPLYPIISFKATDPVVNDEIQLKNGTLLSLSAYKHSSNGSESFGQLKFNTPIRLGKIGLDEAIVLEVDANLRKNPSQTIKPGPFSTTVIYHIEYR